MLLWVYDTEDIGSDSIRNMAPFAPIGANGMYFFCSSGIASHDLFRGDADIRTVLFVKRLDVVYPVSVKNMKLEDEARQMGMPWSWYTAQR